MEFLILLIGLVVVIGLIVVLRVHAFFALITAALVVSLMAPGEWVDKVARVAEAFGATAGGIGIVIAFAAVIGACMMASGAADRIVDAFLSLLGQERAGSVLAGSGFVLSIPVFFDTVFYLLVPLARSTYRKAQSNYVLFVCAIAAGAASTHALVPPTPGPLVMADTLGVDIGMMILIGLLVALPTATAGVLYAYWIDRRMPIPMRPLVDQADTEPLPPEQRPGLGLSLLPIVLPVVLISANTIANTFAGESRFASVMAVLGNANMALLLAAIAAWWGYARSRQPSRTQTQTLIEGALMSGGVIILITAAGGAFGAMLRAAEIGPAIQAAFADGSQSSGLFLLLLGFGIASLLKIAQGSSTVAMITASAMVATMVTPEMLSFHPVYLATAVGSGSLVGSWMNDSGFWIFSKMSVLTEVETLKSWTPLLAIQGIVGMIATLILSFLLPLA